MIQYPEIKDPHRMSAAEYCKCAAIIEKHPRMTEERAIRNFHTYYVWHCRALIEDRDFASREQLQEHFEELCKEAHPDAIGGLKIGLHWKTDELFDQTAFPKQCYKREPIR